MTEKLIYEALHDIPFVIEQTAGYNESPAVFYQQVPHDKDKLWSSNSMFPRIVYNVDWHYNAERKTDGSLMIDVYCLNESVISPEDIGAYIVEALSDLFLTDDSGTHCLLWNRTDSFEISGKEPLVLGFGISFDIVAFPKQQLSIPSPIFGLNQFIKAMQPNCTIIGNDKIPALFKAEDNKPIVYARQTGVRNIRTSYACAWMESDISIHLIAPTLFECNAWVAAIVMDLSLEQEYLMQNESPYLIQSILQRSDANHVQTGQISIKGQYGVMRKVKSTQRLNNIYMEGS